MANLEDYQNEYAFTMSVESLGPIRVWTIDDAGLLILLTRKVRERIEGCSFMKVLVSKCATHLKPDNEREKGEKISLKEAEKLSPEETEQIAEEIIKHHEYLFVDRNTTVFTQLPPNEQGEELCDISEKNLDIPRNEEEAASDYLYRLVLALSEREEIGRKALTESVSKLTSNFSGLGTGFAESFKMPSYPVILPPPNPQHTTNEILRDVLKNLDNQNEINKETAQTNEVTAKLVERLEKRVESWEKKFDEGSIKAGKQVRFANRVAVFFGILTLIIALLSIYLNNKPSINNQSSPQVAAPASPESPQGEKVAVELSEGQFPKISLRTLRGLKRVNGSIYILLPSSADSISKTASFLQLPL